jgi:hypothetical protein
MATGAPLCDVCRPSNGLQELKASQLVGPTHSVVFITADATARLNETAQPPPQRQCCCGRRSTSALAAMPTTATTMLDLSAGVAAPACVVEFDWPCPRSAPPILCSRNHIHRPNPPSLIYSWHQELIKSVAHNFSHAMQSQFCLEMFNFPSVVVARSVVNF